MARADDGVSVEIVDADRPGRVEIGAHLGYLGDPYVRYGGAGGSVTWHLAEVLAVEGWGTVFPDRGVTAAM